MAMLVKHLPPAVTFHMKTTDTLQFVFDEDGLFCSNDSDDFNPRLPHGHEFKAGHTWPNKNEHPDGASPTGDCDATYSFAPGEKGSCEKIKSSASQTIHVGSGIK